MCGGGGGGGGGEGAAKLELTAPHVKLSLVNLTRNTCLVDLCFKSASRTQLENNKVLI